MIVLSLFDGMSCGRISFDRAGIKVDKYYSSEIDKFAIQVSTANYPDIIRLGDITKWREWDIEQPDIIIGGSPCQGFSFAGKRLNLEDERSKLFFEFRDIVRHYNPKYFLLENVRMDKESENVISLEMGIQPVMINSALVSAQNRVRLYWTNINAKKDLFGGLIHGIEQPEDKKIYLKDIIEDGEPDREKANCLISTYYKNTVTDAQVKRTKEKSMHNYIKCGRITGRPIDNPKSRVPGQETKQMLEIREDEKTNCLSTVQKDNVVVVDRCLQIGEADIKGNDQIKRVYSPNGKSPGISTCQGGNREPKISEDNLTWRKLTPIECERLQTVPDNYTNHVSNSQRYKMLGNGWTVDVISHIFHPLSTR